MDHTSREIPLWRRTLGFAGWFIAFLFVSLIVFLIEATNAESAIAASPIAPWLAGAIALSIGFLITRWWRYQLLNKKRIIAERLKHEEHDKNVAPPSKDRFAAILTAIGLVVGIGVGLLAMFKLVALLPVSVAIVIGAVIVGACILLAR